MGKKDQIPPAANQNNAAKEAKNKHLEAALDEALKESFPASDPIAVSFPPAVVDEAPEQNKITGKPQNATKRNNR